MSFEDQAYAAGYEITGAAIRGGSGLVYRAIERATGTTVAIKALAPGFDLDRLRREAEILSRIDHPNVASLRAFIMIDHGPALIVDWVDGIPLSGLIDQRRPLPRGRAFAIFEQIADAMAAVHAAGVVHRDLSPANVLVDRDDRVTVIDFGVSRSMDSATVTVEGMVAGTPRYLAPEVIEGADPTASSDQYSAAIILHELLTGSWPFPEGDAIATAFHHQLHSAPKPLDEIQPDLPPGLCDAVLRALEKDPADRFASMPDMVDGLYDQTPVKRPVEPFKRRPTAASWGFRLGIPLLLIAAFIAWLTGGPDGDEQSASDDDSAIILADENADQNGDEETVDDRPTVSVQVPAAEEPPVEEESTTSLPATTLPEVDGGRIVTGWDAGLAETLACNLLVEADFETAELPKNYFVVPDDPDRALVFVQPDRGVGGTGSLQVGEPRVFGLWGEEIPVAEGKTYLFSANATVTGTVFESELSVFWLGPGFELLGESGSLDLIGLSGSQVTLQTEPAPPGTSFAVPRVYKDAGPGLLWVDEMVFADSDSDCRDLLLG